MYFIAFLFSLIIDKTKTNLLFQNRDLETQVQQERVLNQHKTDELRHAKHRLAFTENALQRVAKSITPLKLQVCICLFCSALNIVYYNNVYPHLVLH